jgi:uncharacterized protein (TIGR02145 family)
MKKMRTPSLSLAALGLAGFTFLAACSGQDGINGTDGANGKDGESCTVVEEPTGTYTMYCGASSSSVATWSDGKDGKDGVCPSCASPAPSSSSAVSACPAYEATTHFCDERDYKVYKYVAIGAQTWMAENLNFRAGVNGTDSTSWCYGDDPAHCTTYGRLYDWTTAMNIDAGYNGSFYANATGESFTTQGVCPTGWHLPSDDELDELMATVVPECTANASCSGAGTLLKVSEGWNASDIPLGTDKYGFSALPGGIRRGGSFYNVGELGYWWSTFEGVGTSEYDDASSALAVNLGYYYEWGGRGHESKSDGFNVRCVKD